MSPQEAAYVSRMSLNDLEAIRLVLSGDSVIDWFRIDVRNGDQLEILLKVNGYDLSNIHDQKRMAYLQQEALKYLDDQYPHQIPQVLREPRLDIRGLFELASLPAKRSASQLFACMILKIMHTINHLDARELFHRCELKASELFAAVEHKVENAVHSMQEEGFHIVDLYGSHKDRASMITKLLAKKENHAAAIYDKIRFRIITKCLPDILPMIYFMGRTICPFNYIIPGGSHNNLISFTDLLGYFPSFQHYTNLLKRRGDSTALHSSAFENEHSSAEYKVINFVSDIPIRVDEFLYTPDFAELGRIIFVPVEFQIMDEVTYQTNELGSASHSKYKQRQLESVKARLGPNGSSLFRT